MIFCNKINAFLGKSKSTPLSNLCEDSVCSFNSLALLAIKSGGKKALSIRAFFVLEDIAQCSAPIIPAREIIPFSSQITIFFSPSSYSFPSSALNFSPFFENLIDISPFNLSISYACIG